MLWEPHCLHLICVSPMLCLLVSSPATHTAAQVVPRVSKSINSALQRGEWQHHWHFGKPWPLPWKEAAEAEHLINDGVLIKWRRSGLQPSPTGTYQQPRSLGWEHQKMKLCPTGCSLAPFVHQPALAVLSHIRAGGWDRKALIIQGLLIRRECYLQPRCQL